MLFDPVILSRIQFSMTIMFHYLFPPLTIGLSALMVFMEAMYLKTGDKKYETMTRFWTGLFAVNFAVGVASGIVMEFQFGTNWSVYSRFVGDVFGSALAAEGVFAFFLESGFLAILVFGWDRVSPKIHFLSTVMVSLGSTFSAVWIIVANSFQQTPAGYHIVGTGLMRRCEITDFWALVFNPSSMIRLTHTVVGAYLMGSFFVMSITAYYILKGRHLDFAKKAFTIALVFASVCSLTQLALGHIHAIEVSRYQPAKLAAYEGHFKTGEGGTALHLIGVPDSQAGEVRFSVAIPGLLSYMVYGDANKPVPGLDKFPEKDRPPVMIPFFSYHIMVAIGMYFIGLTLLGLVLLKNGRLFKIPALLWVYVISVLAAIVANQAGWTANEVGRQPWIVYNELRTSEAVSKSVPASNIIISIVLFGIIYALLTAVWIYVLNDKIHQGPVESDHDEHSSNEGLMQAFTSLEDPGGPSMTEAKQ